jgi:hypothetical protein
MPVCVGPSASAVHIAPTLTLNSSTNYNQNSGVLNATVTATGNRPITSVEFQWSTSSTFASGNSNFTAASTNTLIPQGTANTARTLSVSLPNATNTTFYVRFRTTNASGFVTTSSIGASFKTYRSVPLTFTSSGTWTNPVPTSGTSGLAITQLLNLECRAGGGAGSYWFGAGGGAGARTTSSSATISGNVTVTIGGGGSGSNITAGGSTSIGSALSASGGQPGGFAAFDPPEPGGASGNGNAGGSSVVSGGTGGGGGTNGVGSNGTSTTGGAGGAGWGGGNGVGGRGCDAVDGYQGANGGAYTGNGGGGTTNLFDGVFPDIVQANGGNGGSGYAYFEYWGP